MPNQSECKYIVFCFENCYGEKNILVIEFFFWKFEDEGQIFTTFLWWVEQWNTIGNWNKYLGFINQQEKVRIENIPALKSGKEIFWSGCSRF